MGIKTASVKPDRIIGLVDFFIKIGAVVIAQKKHCNTTCSVFLQTDEQAVFIMFR